MFALVYTQVMLFTYTDKDGFVPPSDKADGGAGGHGKLTTGDGGPHSYLEEAVTNMPRKAATSSVEPPAAAGGAGGGARAGVSETAAVIQTHLAREDKFKVKRTAGCELSVCTFRVFDDEEDSEKEKGALHTRNCPPM